MYVLKQSTQKMLRELGVRLARIMRQYWPDLICFITLVKPLSYIPQHFLPRQPLPVALTASSAAFLFSFFTLCTFFYALYRWRIPINVRLRWCNKISSWGIRGCDEWGWWVSNIEAGGKSDFCSHTWGSLSRQTSVHTLTSGSAWACSLKSILKLYLFVLTISIK